MARVVITGANRGIGLALTQLFVERGDAVVAIVRKSSPELDRTGAEVRDGVEITDDASVAELVKSLGDKPVDVLVNNAGALIPDGLSHLDFDGMRAQFELNTLAPIRVTAAMLPLMRHGSKVAIVTSRSGSIGDNGSGGNFGYRMSKAAVNMAGINLALALKPQGIPVALLHPGMVRTGMGSGGVAPRDSAARLIARIDEMTIDKTGQFLHAEGHVLPW